MGELSGLLTRFGVLVKRKGTASEVGTRTQIAAYSIEVFERSLSKSLPLKTQLKLANPVELSWG